MRRTVLARIEALEARFQSSKPYFLRTGWLASALPQDYEGERHYVVVKREPTSSPLIEWCEFEERAGPAPPGHSNEYIGDEVAA
jgi:hypothetical protein